MGSSESESTAISNTNKNPESGFRSTPSIPIPDHDSEPSDLNHAEAEADALHGEVQDKLVLKDKDGGGETVRNDYKLDGGGAEESDKGDGWGEDNGDWNGNEDNNWNENVNDNENDKVGKDFNVTVDEAEGKEERSSGKGHQYPVRPEAEDCAFYLKTGTCKFGFYCKFNHPVGRKNQVSLSSFFLL